MFERVEELVTENADLESQLADPALHSDPKAARRAGRRHAELRNIVQTYGLWKRLGQDLQAATEMAETDPEFAAEAVELRAARDDAADKLTGLLIPREALDGSDVILEIKSGEGGDESALFAGDLVRMYTRYAEARNWKIELISAVESDLGGYKDIAIAVKAKGVPERDESPYDRLRYEGGVHRVQRVPVTESQGRVHTSAAGVLVLPETEEIEVDIDPNDLKIDVYRSSGPGGQSVNTTDSAVRITHIPTGVVAACQNEKSQLQNKEAAMRVLRARLIALEEERVAAEASDVRRSQVRTVDRSERIRTYNYPENRLADHRTGYKSYNLDQVLDGDLDPVIQSCVDADRAARIAGDS